MRRFEFLSWRTTRSRVLSVAAGALAIAASLAAPSHAGTVTFGRGANQFNMEFVTIGNPGNAFDPTGSPANPTLGSVARIYDIGMYEVSRDMAPKYNANPATVALDLQAITSYGGNRANIPVTGINWNEAARFVNWLNTEKGFAPAYKFTTGGRDGNIALWDPADILDYDATNRFRSIRANFFLPSSNEWYKAAHYDPNKSGGAGYWDYANGADTAPTQLTSAGGATGAVYNNNVNLGPADVTNAGGLSPYGVMGLNGNAQEWNETTANLLNSDVTAAREYRGGAWDSPSSRLMSTSSPSSFPQLAGISDLRFGFRVASYNSDAAIPEPSMMVIGMVFGLGGVAAKRRLKK